MKTLLEKEQLRLASWTAAIHYNTNNIHVHIAIVDPEGEREKVKDGKYAGEPKGTWNIRTIRYAKSAAVNELLELDQEMKQLNELMRDCIIKPLRNKDNMKYCFKMNWNNCLQSWNNRCRTFTSGNMDFGNETISKRN